MTIDHDRFIRPYCSKRQQAFMMRFTVLILALLAATVHAADNTTTSTCDVINPEDLPEECKCRDGDSPLSLVIECLKPFDSELFNDTVGLKLTVEPCNEQGSSVSLDITDLERGIDYPISQIRAGEQQIYPIPGLSIAVPQIGHFGVDAVVEIEGNPDKLTIQVGLDACIAVRSKFVCAEVVPGLKDILPWWVLNGTYTFGNMCSNITETAIM